MDVSILDRLTCCGKVGMVGFASAGLLGRINGCVANCSYGPLEVASSIYSTIGDSVGALLATRPSTRQAVTASSACVNDLVITPHYASVRASRPS